MNQEIKNSDLHRQQDELTVLEPSLRNQISYNDKHELVLLANDFRKEKKLGFIAPEKLAEEIERLKANYTQLSQMVSELKSQWEQATDRLSLREAVTHLERKLQTAEAIGDFSEVKNLLDECQSEINRILDANGEKRKEIAALAKSLVESTEWHQTTERFKEIIEEWKSAPETHRKLQEQLWNEIVEAKNTFFERKREYFEELEKEQMLNLDRKLELCEKAEAIKDSTEWKKTTEVFQSLFEEWKSIGPVTSAEKNEELWERFSSARKYFFDRKQEHSNAIREEQQHNYKQKLAIVEEAEMLSSSTQWKETAQRFDELQRLWDSIGRAPEAYNDELWKRWRAAKNTFFEAKRKHAKEYLQSLQQNYERKKALTERAEHLAESNNWGAATAELTQMMIEWKTIGPIPKEYGDELWERFNLARKKFFNRKDEDREKCKEFYEKKRQERIKQTERFLQTLERELADDQAKIAEFTESLSRLNEENKKDRELKEHLTQLISKIQRDIEKRNKKIEQVKKELEELVRRSEQDSSKKQHD